MDVFEAMHSLRSMRRLKPDPVPDELIHKILDAAIRAPNGQNTQPWSFMVVRDEAKRQFFKDQYLHHMMRIFGDRIPEPDDTSSTARTIRAAVYLAEHMHEVPVLLVVCGKRDWPFRVPPEERKGLAPPSYGSVYPAIQNILLACRALKLGACLTTLHQCFELEWCETLGIPDEYGIVSVIPVGWPKGKFGPVTRSPVEEVCFADQWGKPYAPDL